MSINGMSRVVLCQLLLAISTSLCLTAGAAELNHNEEDTIDSVKNSSAATTEQADAKNTANVVNQLPGEKVKAEDLQTQDEPIKGFHPIKKLLRPVENLEDTSVKLEQQVTNLEKPISTLEPPMLSLQHKMTGVDQNLGGVQTGITKVQSQMTGVRSDIASMRKDIESLRVPIVGLKGPVAGVAGPIETLQAQLNYILLAILVAVLGIAIGTPLVAIFIYKNRHRLFPNEIDMPKVSVQSDQKHTGIE